MRTVAQHPERQAIKPLDGPAWTYGRLAAEVRVAVAVMQRLGLTPGDSIAIWLPNRPEWAVLLYGAALLGLRVVPVNTRLRSAELAHVLRHALPKALFTQERFLTNEFLLRLEEATTQEMAPRPPFVIAIEGAPRARTVSYLDLADHVTPALDLANLAAKRSAEEVLWLFFTSGTTSAPKGVLLSNRALADIWAWTSMVGYRADDRVLMTRPLFYVAGHFWCMVGPMLHGALAVVGERFDAEEITRLAAAEKITVLSGNPLLLKGLVSNPGFDPASVVHVRIGYFGGASVSLPDLQRIHVAFPHATFMQVYGTTELGGFALSTLPADSVQDVWETCGVPLPGAELQLVDPETGLPAPAGATGMLIARSPAFCGYIAVPVDELAKLVTADGRVRTGDLLRVRPDGRWQFVGRAKDLIKVGGENATAAEIEGVLQAHPAIREAAVIPVPDDERGEVPFAFVEAEPDAALSIDDLPRWCRERMAPFKVPRYFEEVASGGWPMTASGKIAKHVLATKTQRRLESAD